MHKVLIIDDDKGMRSMLMQMMEREGIESIAAQDGKQGLQCIDSFLPDLIITDIIMPEKEGLETVMEIRRKHPEIQIIAISGGGKAGPESYLPLAKHFGARYTFQKPLNRKTFLDAVRECLDPGVPGQEQEII